MVSIASLSGSYWVARCLAARGAGVENSGGGRDVCVVDAAVTLNRGVEANWCRPVWSGVAVCDCVCDCFCFCDCDCDCGAWRLESRKRGCAGVWVGEI